MDHIEAGEYWNKNAEAWTTMARAGYDVYRDMLNTPAFFEHLPPVKGLKGIDIGCGEGHNTRLLARKGAHLNAIDISPVFISHAKAEEVKNPLGIQYEVASAAELPFEDESFDFAASFMCMMDIPDPALSLKEAFRVLKPGGFLQFSITHPCFSTPHRKNLRNEFGLTYAVEIGQYFRKKHGWIEEWTFGSAPKELSGQFEKFKVPYFNYLLSDWINMIIKTGFILEFMHEPCPDEATAEKYPYLQDAAQISYFLHIRCRKPGNGKI